MLKKILTLSIILSFFSHSYGAENSDKQKVMAGLAAILKFEKVWHKTLTRKLKEDSKGVVAIEYCSQNAIKMTNELNEQFNNITVKRTSLKNRNPLNAPDSTDIQVLEEFDDLAKNRQNVDMKIISPKDSIKIYKPLVITKPVCLKCHGTKIKIHPQIKQILDEKYPNDKAVNFRYKNVRGAIVATVKK